MYYVIIIIITLLKSFRDKGDSIWFSGDIRFILCRSLHMGARGLNNNDNICDRLAIDNLSMHRNCLVSISSQQLYRSVIDIIQPWLDTGNVRTWINMHSAPKYESPTQPNS